ncbi:hypothetical protein [Corynebacterium diphtheriae]|uniref:hypothetical protein n=1 Tax=Corynebacterium diphtheriae TaxID=1717 RepID=UPI0015A50CCC|nr:hypothetical protein [Corynebacterium diphtheriae]MBG9318010.1 hypothetical protein [Corynebacterium diphtheriae bv. mitis]
MPNARAATAEEAAQAGDIVVVTIPLNSLHEIPIEQLDSREITTSPILQDRVPEAKVVKAFNPPLGRACASGACRRSHLAGDRRRRRQRHTFPRV